MAITAPPATNSMAIRALISRISRIQKGIPQDTLDRTGGIQRPLSQLHSSFSVEEEPSIPTREALTAPRGVRLEWVNFTRGGLDSATSVFIISVSTGNESR
ncbi:hypothetical protein CRG98_029041 [Punica granatum]|uniref:Uncharacterized protein n=1 Tax=Punica granatum TaxID=22663 RepID=A0A2I0J2V9_PUNGR|nr:hypothetical protein CRG98_029041 [Punica granatum]